MGVLADYRKKWQEHRRKRRENEAAALKASHDEPSPNQPGDWVDRMKHGGG
jgi:hypothetical protein